MIIIYDMTLNKKQVITRFTSMQWTKRFYDTGSFELHLPVDTDMSSVAVEDIVQHGENWGFLMRMEYTPREIILTGFDLCGIMTFRTLKAYSGTQKPSVIMSNAVSQGFRSNIYGTTEAQRTARRVDYLYSKGGGTEAAIRYQYDAGITIAGLFQRIGTENNIGYEIYGEPDTKQIWCEFLTPRDISANLHFSTRNGSITNYSYQYDLYDAPNTVAGYNPLWADYPEIYSPDGTDSSKKGLRRREVGITHEYNSPGWELSNLLGSELGKYVVTDCITAEISDKYRFRQDFLLGDYVTVRVELPQEAVEQKKQITEVTQVYEPENRSETVKFGEQRENIIRRLKKGGS